MQYTDLTKKELQREYNRMARRYTGFVREPLQLDMAEEDPLLGKSESLRAARHFGTVLNKELSDSGAARPTDAQDAVAALSTMPGCAHRTAELCRQAGVRFERGGSQHDPGPHHPGGCWFRTAGPRSQRVCH